MTVENELKTYELDELYHFTNRRPRTETRENAYVMTMVSRFPRQIAGFDVAADKCSWRIQRMVDGAPWANKYCTDGYFGYLDVIYPGEHVYNSHNKNDTFTVESVNADLRHYIPLLRRKSKCFPRSIDTLHAVVAVFAEAYNKFGRAKSVWQTHNPHKRCPLAFVDFL